MVTQSPGTNWQLKDLAMPPTTYNPYPKELKNPDSCKAQSPNIPPYLLQDVLIHLSLFDLLDCRRVCRLWNAVIMSRRHLRQKLFIQQSDIDPAPFIDGPPDKLSFELHPVFSMIHFDPSLCVEDTTFGRKHEAYLKDSNVRSNYATSPAATRVSFEVLKFHPHCIVENPTGVTVWDVLVRLAE